MDKQAEAIDAILYNMGLYVPPSGVRRFIGDLRTAGWIVVRHDAIRLAQAHARQEAKEAA